MELKHPSEPENLSHLSEIFNKIVSECKVNRQDENNNCVHHLTKSHNSSYTNHLSLSLQTTLPLLDDLLSVTVKLESELVSVCSVFTAFLDCVQKLRDSAVNTQSTGRYHYSWKWLKRVALLVFVCRSFCHQSKKRSFNERLTEHLSSISFKIALYFLSIKMHYLTTTTTRHYNEICCKIQLSVVLV